MGEIGDAMGTKTPVRASLLSATGNGRPYGKAHLVESAANIVIVEEFWSSRPIRKGFASCTACDMLVSTYQRRNHDDQQTGRTLPAGQHARAGRDEPAPRARGRGPAPRLAGRRRVLRQRRLRRQGSRRA